MAAVSPPKVLPIGLSSPWSKLSGCDTANPASYPSGTKLIFGFLGGLDRKGNTVSVLVTASLALAVYTCHFGDTLLVSPTSECNLRLHMLHKITGGALNCLLISYT